MSESFRRISYNVRKRFVRSSGPFCYYGNYVLTPGTCQHTTRRSMAVSTGTFSSPLIELKSKSGTAPAYARRPASHLRITGRRSKSPYNYEEPITDREEWWRSTLKDTPVPGTYESKDFVGDINSNPIKATYGFKNTGRRKNADPSRTGTALMPGLYKHETEVDKMDKRQITYSFKSCDRYHTPNALVGYMDKEFVKSQISPTTYDPGYKYVPKLPSKHPAFKSQVNRFPTVYFKARVGPPPGQYNLSKDSILPKGPNITSSFKSKTPRFQQPHVLKTPGPGTYDKTFQTPMPATIKKMGRSHGLFFTCGAY